MSTNHQNYIKALLVYTIFFLFNTNSFGQACNLSGVTAAIGNVQGATVNNGISTVTGSINAGGAGVGNPLDITATGCGTISMDVTIDFEWYQGVNLNWIHGITFTNSPGWTVSQGTNPGPGWLYQNSIVGCCSGAAYDAGFYYDGTAATSNCCGGATPGNPADNFGINCTDDCGSFTFSLEYCPDGTGNITEAISFTLTDDGETGDWSQPSGCVFGLTFPIQIDDAGFDLPSDPIGPVCEGDAVTLSAESGCLNVTYQWGNGLGSASTVIVFPSMTTIYCVTANASGCNQSSCVEVLVEDCTAPCPPDYNLSGTESGIYDYETNGIIISSQIIDATAKVDYDSAIEINMNAGFEVVLGAEFNAFIDGCNSGGGGINVQSESSNQ